MSAASTAMPAVARPTPRNPGPSWGIGFLLAADRVLPEVIYRPLRAAGSAVAALGMHRARRHSREYLTAVLGRPPTLRETFRHFFAFEEMLMLKLRVTTGLRHRCVFAPGAEAFAAWMQAGTPALLGTFHVGRSDLSGFLLAAHLRRKVYLVRQRVRNSADTEALVRRFSDLMEFIWVNDPRDMLFALKNAATANDGAIALQCDRVAHSSRLEPFDFLGARRLFPFTLYHLAVLFQRPVFLSVALSAPDPALTMLHSSEPFIPVPGEDRAEALARGHVHFQAFLTQLDGLLRAQPFEWFNFLPLNPPVS